MHYLIAVFFSFFVGSIFAQIEIGGEPEKKEEASKDTVKKVKKEYDLDGSTSIFFVANWSSTDRILEVNEGLFAKPLGEREFETGRELWSFGFGLRSNLGRGVFWEGGLAFLRNGERYNFSEADTAFSYQTVYHYIGLPIKVGYVYGDKLRFSGSAGIIPQMFFSYTKATQWRTEEGTEHSDFIKSNSGFNSFVVSAVANLGVHYRYSEVWEIYIQPEYRRQLTSSFMQQAPYKHFGTAIGINFGLTRFL